MSDMKNEIKFMEQWEHCRTCSYRELDEDEEPCAECVLLVFDEVTDKPINWTFDGTKGYSKDLSDHVKNNPVKIFRDED